MKKYRFGISTTVDYTIDIHMQLPLFAQAGFQFISLGGRLEHCDFRSEKKFQEILKKVSDLGLFIESVHAPFGEELDLASPDRDVRDYAVDMLLELSARAVNYQIPLVIIHPHHFFGDSREACLDRAIASLAGIVSLRPAQISMAIENLPGTECSWICERLLEAFDYSKIGLCYDSSHENISGEPFHLLEKHIDRLITCHLSDNRGTYDEHLIPGDGNIDWAALKSYFDKAPKLENILFEVGTGEKLTEPIEHVIRRSADKARRIFG